MLARCCLALSEKGAGLEALENVLELTQHLLGHVLRARLGELLDIVEKLVELLVGDHLLAVLALLLWQIAFLLGLLGKRLEIAAKGAAQFIDQALDLFRRGALLQGFGELLLRLLHVPLGLGNVAVLDAERQLPELVHHARDRLRRLIVVEPPIGIAQRKIDGHVRDRALIADGQRIERHGDPARRILLAHELLALLDHGSGERLGEIPLRQDEFVRLAQARLTGLVARGEYHTHLQASPGMRGQVLRCLALHLLHIDLRQLQRHQRRFA